MEKKVKKKRKPRVVTSVATQRNREPYSYSRKDLLDLGMTKMEADLQIFKYLSELPSFKDFNILYTEQSTLLIGDLPVHYEKKFLDYRQAMEVVRGTNGIINRVENKTFECPNGEKYCKRFLARQGKGRSPINQDKINAIIEKHNQGMSIRQISKELGVVPSVVHKYIKIQGGELK